LVGDQGVSSIKEAKHLQSNSEGPYRGELDELLKSVDGTQQAIAGSLGFLLLGQVLKLLLLVADDLPDLEE